MYTCCKHTLAVRLRWSPDADQMRTPDTPPALELPQLVSMTLPAVGWWVEERAAKLLVVVWLTCSRLIL